MDIKYYLRRLTFLRTWYYGMRFYKIKNGLPSEVKNTNRLLLEPLRGKYVGNRCFIIGNGPSLKIEDLEKLKGEYTFASNRIFSLYEKTEWRPTFFVSQDEEVIRSILKNLKGCIKNSALSFISMNMYDECNTSIKDADNLVWFPLRFTPPKKFIYKFSEDVLKEVYEGLTVTYTCMQIAAYMGFSEIYLLGVDHSYGVIIDNDGKVISNDKNVQEHFNEAKKIEIKDRTLPKIVEMTRAYNSAELYSKDRPFKIFNATRGGKLEVYDRVEFDTLF